MKTLIVVVALAYSFGTAPFCTVDNYGNMNCYYYSYSSCKSACDYNSSCVACAVNPSQQ